VLVLACDDFVATGTALAAAMGAMNRRSAFLQIAAYLAVALTGAASIATACGGAPVAASGPRGSVTLTESQPSQTLQFSVRTNAKPYVAARVNVSARSPANIQAMVFPGSNAGSDAGDVTAVGGTEKNLVLCADDACSRTIILTLELSNAAPGQSVVVEYALEATAQTDSCDDNDSIFVEVSPL
jgi:hypothetical protein